MDVTGLRPFQMTSGEYAAGFSRILVSRTGSLEPGSSKQRSVQRTRCTTVGGSEKSKGRTPVTGTGVRKTEYQTSHLPILVRAGS